MVKKNKQFTYSAPKYTRYATCKICKEEALLCEHHIFKRVIFGENERVDYVCKKCNERIDASIKIFEAEILNKFACCYAMIWKSYIEGNKISKAMISRAVRKRFKKIRRESFRIRESAVHESQKTKRENLTKDQQDFLEAKICPVCGKKKNLTIHHIRKWIIFKSNRELGFPCRKCHNEIEDAVSFFESEVLKHFGSSYRYIWSMYCKEGSISDIAIRRLAKNQFTTVKNKLFGTSNRHQEKVIMKKIAQQKSAESMILLKERKINA